MAPTKTRFIEGEKVLCYHGSVLYEAKIIRSELKDKMVHYLVHYGGWSKNWDEWVPENRTLKYTEANLTKQKELMAQCKALWKAKKSKAKQAKKEAKNTETPSPSRKSEKEALLKKSDIKRTESSANSSFTKSSEKLTIERSTKRGSIASSTTVIIQPAVTPSTPSTTTTPSGVSSTSVATDTTIITTTNTTTTTTTTTTILATPATWPVEQQQPLPTPEPKRKKSKLLAANENLQQMEEVIPKREVNIKLLDGLKKVLVDDQDLILRQKQLLVLPAHNSIDNIMKEYMEFEKSQNPSNIKLSSKDEVLKGIKDYFNVTLGSQLLYKFERSQYSEILLSNKDKPLSSIYGAHHLLRLFVKLGLLLSYTNMNEKSIDMILPHIDQFIVYLDRNMATLFTLDAYEVATPEYYRRCLTV